MLAPPRVNQVGTVVLTDHHQLAFYQRAYCAGAAVAHLDSTPESAADVIEARARGEILAPASLLASCLQGEHITLTASERTVLRHIAAGDSVAATANETFYSERHVRRILQAILAKAGTNDRSAAIAHFAEELETDSA